MSDQEIVETKKGRTKKNGQPDGRSTTSAANVSKARSKVKAFLKAGKQIIENSDTDTDDDIIDIVIRKKEEEKPDIIRRKPLKEVLKKKAKKKQFYQPDSDNEESESEEEVIVAQPKISKSKAKLIEMENKHKELQDQLELMKRGIIETSNRKSDNDIDMLRKKMILRF